MTRRRRDGFSWHRLVILAGAIALVTAMPSLTAQSSPGGTLDRIRDSGRIRLGYRADARPFSYTGDHGDATGYSVAICQQVADAIKRELQLPALALDWVPVTPQERFHAAQQGTIDLLCGADTITLERRAQVAFSTPIFPGGIGTMVRADTPAALRDVLSGKGQTFRPTWRAAATQILQAKAFSAVSGTTAEQWLTKRINELQVVTTVVPSSSYNAGIAALRGRQVDALFGERAILLDAARRDASARDLVVLDRLFTSEPLALAMGANDDGFRLIVDRTIARLHTSGELVALYTKWFGEPDQSTVTFFRWNALSE
jgi:polar amino acid transport system substrate-binding protein